MSEVKERKSSEYRNLSERFLTLNNDYSKQYCRIYNKRLMRMREVLKDAVAKKWGDEYPICELHKLSEVDYDRCVIIGTLFKDQKLKPSILKQLAEVNNLIPQPIVSHYVDESDTLHLEDELQRFQLEGDLPCENLVTGICCALLGYDTGKGKFHVTDHIFADYGVQIQRPIQKDDTYVVFISGLDLLHLEKCGLESKIFAHWVAGHLTTTMQDIEIDKIVRVIIAGDSIQTSLEKSDSVFSMTSRVSQSMKTIEAVKLVDCFLLELCENIDVDVMPGENDPSNHILPQQAMHHCMFPKSNVYESLNLVTNPYECEIDGVEILGSSGQPVKDILKYSNIETPIDALESCLRWNHIAPTAPDTLGCYPFYESDPFIMEQCPHVFFSSNHEKFDTKMSTGLNGQTVRLICVPDFSTTLTTCVLNLKDLDCKSIKFSF